MKLYVAVKAENDRKVAEILADNNLLLETRASANEEVINRFIASRIADQEGFFSHWYKRIVEIPMPCD